MNVYVCVGAKCMCTCARRVHDENKGTPLGRWQTAVWCSGPLEVGKKPWGGGERSEAKRASERECIGVSRVRVRGVQKASQPAERFKCDHTL